MKSDTPKVLHQIAGRTLLGHVLEAAAGLEPHHVMVVVGHGRDEVRAHLAEIAPWCLTVTQEEQLGTGHAVRIALTELAGAGIPFTDGPVVVLAGDTPLLTTGTLHHLLAAHAERAAAATVLTTVLSDPSGYGRIIRNGPGDVVEIVEDADASDEQRAITEINSGMYAFDGPALVRAIGSLSRGNAQNEEYLTEIITILTGTGATVTASLADSPDDIRGVNDRLQLSEVAAIMRDRINAEWMRSGVSILDSSTTWLDVDVEIAPDATILPNTTLRGPTAIAAGATIGPGTTLASCEVGADARVIHTWGELAVIGAGATVGPFTYLRPGAVLGAGAKAGAFVEIKNASVGENAKVPHLSYVGDATIGRGTNIGAATVFVNYDGQEKHHTHVGEDVRIGSDTMLVAPVTIGDGAYTAAGSVITDDVPPGAMGVGRSRQRNILQWVMRRRPGSASAIAAENAHVQERGNTNQEDQ